ncbi:DNA mismatch repair protein MutT [Streptomyces sp. WAC 06725]|uniref:bifunctional class I SAM-dependent methyltransferase/NUDIX hydrolase n=1 Tax=Streptomyces sp. WAC 06725 TaxID=2203209 RepID=UPI000F73D54E|nr:NUDIX domain-containing protein [Streptomyces sp. WAC 06725]RSO14740.1 DNA mismatch repair protein MutT [Streptomyces sp. WAC 06725]
MLLASRVPARAGAVALDVGCGRGELARHLAATGYRVDAVDYSPVAIAAAQEETPAHSDSDGVADGVVTYVHLDIERDPLAALPQPAYDLITFRLSYAFVQDRARVLHRLRERLRPGGALCVITPVADAVPPGKRGIALDEEEIVLLSAGWDTAERYDAEGLALLMLRGPLRTPVTYGNRGKPAPHALTGAGAVVTDETGRVLLGRSVHGLWELPGGKNAGGESFVRAAVRELEEETGLRAEAADARLVAMVMDEVHGMPRVTAAVRITAYTGAPVVREPELVRRWEWHEVADLPALAGGLFVPSAHVLETVWPGSLPGLPPVHRYHVVEAAPS